MRKAVIVPEIKRNKQIYENIIVSEKNCEILCDFMWIRQSEIVFETEKRDGNWEIVFEIERSKEN